MKILETGSGKYIQIKNEQIAFVSSHTNASDFSSLTEALEIFPKELSWLYEKDCLELVE